MPKTLAYRAGPARHIVQVQARTAAQDAYGEAILTWATTHTRRAHIESLTGTELIEARKVQANATHRVRLRFSNQIDPQSRLLFGSRTFEILHVANPEERDKLQEILVREKVV